MKKSGKFAWTDEAHKACTKLKQTLLTPPILAVPKEREPLYLYIAARNSVVSTVLIAERSEEGKAHGVQRPIYYLIEVLTSAQ